MGFPYVFFTRVGIGTRTVWGGSFVPAGGAELAAATAGAAGEAPDKSASLALLCRSSMCVYLGEHREKNQRLLYGKQLKPSPESGLD